MFRALLERLGRKPSPPVAARPSAKPAVAPPKPPAAAPSTASIAALTEREAVIAIALKHRGEAREAALAHPLLRSAAAVQELERRSRGVDKTVNRHARVALEQLRTHQQEAAAARARLEELLVARARQTAANDRTAWERDVELHARCLDALAAHAAADAALAPWDETLPGIEDLRARVAPPGPEPVLAPDPIELAATTPLPVAEAVPAVAATDEAAPAEATSDNTVVTHTEFPVPSTAEAIVEAPNPEPAVDRAQQAAEAAERKAQVERAERVLDRAEAALADGQTQAARDGLVTARRALTDLGDHAPRALTRRVARLGNQIMELRDWQTFVTAPKREALCADLQTLIDQPLAPPDQLQRLKAVRAAWRELGPITRREDHALGERFESLAELAFAPCKTWFAEQAALRAENLAARERICEELAVYVRDTDWARADMQAADQILRTARAAWLAHAPVDRDAAKAVETRFEELQSSLHETIRNHWARKAEVKLHIVTAAEALLQDESPLADRLQRAKALQQDWRDIGPLQPRAREQELWTAFRSACDTLFAARDAERRAADDAQTARVSAAAAVLETIEAELAALADDGVPAATLHNLRDRLGALDDLPAPARQPFRDRRQAVLDRLKSLEGASARHALRDTLAALAQADADLSVAEMAARSGAPAPEISDRRFATRRGRHGDPVPFDELARLTIQAELRAGLESPPADAALRMDVQVGRLREGLAGSRDESPLALAYAWCALGPKDDSVNPLRERFFAAIGAGA
ncbi:MAG: DUF349 domain-containing protein [Pseudomonadales bacterium]